MLKQVQHDKIETKDEIATGTTCHLPKARKRVRNGEEDAETRLGVIRAKKRAERQYWILINQLYYFV